MGFGGFDGLSHLASGLSRLASGGVARGFRDEFPRPDHLYTTDDLGGWASLYDDLFDGDDGAITNIYAEATR